MITFAETIAVAVLKLVETKEDGKEFVNLPFLLYKGNPNWAPPLKEGELKSLFPATNPAFKYCKAKFWLAKDGKKTVGRIGAIVHEPYNKKTGEKWVRFTRFECINDIGTATLLVNAAMDFGKSHGMEKIHGPLGFSNLDTQGMLVEGFDHLQSIGSVYHLPYYHVLLEQLGFQKEMDWVEFRLTLSEAPVEKANRGAELIKKRYGIEVVHFKRTAELLPHSKELFGILNDAFSQLPFVTPLSPEMMEFYKDKYLKLVNPSFVKMLRMKGELIGFVIGMPSLSEAMQKASGSLLPFGWIHLLHAMKGKSVLDQMLTGVKQEHQATGAGVILMAELQKEMIKRGMQHIETTGIFETNTPAISNWKNYQNIQHKRKRCYFKVIQ